MNRPQTAVTGRNATPTGVLGMLGGAGVAKAGLGSPQHAARKALPSFADTAVLGAAAAPQGGKGAPDGADAGAHLRPQSAAPAHTNKRMLSSHSFSGKAPICPGSPSQLGAHLSSPQRSSSPALPRPGTAHASGGLPLERRPSTGGSSGSSSGSSRSNCVPGAGVGDWLNPPIENDGPLEREGPAAMAGGARQRPCTASAGGVIRRPRRTAGDAEGNEWAGGDAEGKGDLAAMRRELEHARGEVARIANERDLLRATLMQATRDKPGLMKLGHPVSMAKKDSLRLPQVLQKGPDSARRAI